MRVLLAFDKFKDSLTAAQACAAAARGLRSRGGDWKIDAAPLTDGGDGFAAVLGRESGGETLPARAVGPRGDLREAALTLVRWSRVPPAARDLLQSRLAIPVAADTRIALVEMAATSGLALLPPERRDPWHTTSLGTGQLIRAAAELGADAVVLGIGGSATSDLGLGALGALGLEYRAGGGTRVRPGVPAQWERIQHIEGAVFPAIPPLWIACDVDNPLLGPRGAAAVYGPQKGLAPGDVARLDAAAARMAALLCAHTGRPLSLTEEPGAGAAGGIAFGLRAAARAALVPGADLVAAWLRLDERVAAADLVLTGEGRFDDTSLAGKGPGAVIRRARALGKPVHVFAGAIDPGVADGDPALRLTAITPPPLPLAEALAQAAELLAAAVGRAEL